MKYLDLCIFFSPKMCNQVRVKKSVTEDLNGNCKLMNPSGRVIEKLNPVALGKIR